jgi:hypothetical protein
VAHKKYTLSLSYDYGDFFYNLLSVVFPQRFLYAAIQGLNNAAMHAKILDGN